MTFDAATAYEKMYLCRQVDLKIAQVYGGYGASYNPMRTPTHLSLGQESCAVGVMMALLADAHVFASHRCHAAYLAKGGNLDAMIAELYGKGTGCCGGRGGSMHLRDKAAGFMGAFPIVGDGVSLATGAALAAKLEGSDRVTAVFFGDAAMESGQVWESFNFAATHKLRLLYVCENNRLATQTPVEQRQPGSSNIWQRVLPFMQSNRVTDKDVEVIYKTVQTMLHELPAFLEIRTHRWAEHVGPIIEMAKPEYDPLEILGALLPATQRDDIEWAVEFAVSEAFQKAESAPWAEVEVAV